MTAQVTTQGDALDARIAQYIAQGWRFEGRYGNQATIAGGRRVNHILHLILSIITFGLWLIVWLIMGMAGGEKRRVLTLQPDGTVTDKKA